MPMNTVTKKSIWLSALSETGLSLRALARDAGISHTYLRQIIDGQKNPSEPIRQRLLDRLKNYRPEDLFVPLIKAAPPVLCKRCNGPNTIKSGLLQGLQRFQCKDCGCVFISNDAPLHGRLPAAVAVSVMEMFFAGDSLASIRTLLEDTQGLQVTVSGLEKMIYRLSRKAVKFAGDILPEVHDLWVLDGAYIPGSEDAVILDILDIDSGFIIASDVIRQDYAEKDRESVLQKALRITGLTPAILIMGPGVSSEYPDVEDSSGFQRIEYNLAQEAHVRRYVDLLPAKTLLLARRLSFDSINNQRLLSAAWRVHFNFGVAFPSPYRSWLDILNVSELPEPLSLSSRMNAGESGLKASN